jgi:urease accessory protein
MKSMFDVTAPLNLTGYSKPLDSAEVGVANSSDRDLQRADGCGRAVLSGSERGTRITELFQRSPIRVIFPRIGDVAVKEAVLINTAGGIAGGDRLEYNVTALANASITVTSQAAEKVYRALSEPARIATKLKVDGTSKLAWLPRKQSSSIGHVSGARQRLSSLQERSCLPWNGLYLVVPRMART